MVIFNQFVLFQ